MLIGVLSAAGEGLLLLLAGVVTAVTTVAPPARRRVAAVVIRYARRVVEWERRRLARFAGRPDPPPVRVGASRLLAYLAVRLLPGALGALAFGLLAVGVVLAAIVVRAVLVGSMAVPQLLTQVVIGSALLVVNLQAIASIAALDRRLARALLQASSREALQRRIDELTASRAAVMSAVDAERQRIERDLHDGLQQRLVALGLLLGRARRSRDPDTARELLVQAHVDTRRAIEDLREVAWRVYPSALEQSTLDEVLALVAQRSTIPVRISYTLSLRPPRPVETVLYFVACEAITNAVKHAHATVITIEITPVGTEVEMLVHDDGVGGANPHGTGLQGLARRAAALDGRFAVDSPPDGPTTIRAVLPCA
ncbi:sensor histidine kinase [Micromonospora sp. KC723]|uniref:sensor histidine kinase n=1 Tax=Micromonospora sp. KC723 TaxID=2530381 RepID=UPI00104D885D|nr:histidine kinase [Micromonospora sp. KC723]TDB74746.1 two-component sensor histidine kinase [Micromonospora sp. KC723]